MLPSSFLLLPPSALPHASPSFPRIRPPWKHDPRLWTVEPPVPPNPQVSRRFPKDPKKIPFQGHHSKFEFLECCLKNADDPPGGGFAPPLGGSLHSLAAERFELRAMALERDVFDFFGNISKTRNHVGGYWRLLVAIGRLLAGYWQLLGGYWLAIGGYWAAIGCHPKS